MNILNELKLPSNKKFGLFFSFIFIFISSYFFFKSNFILTYIFLVVSFIFLLLGLFFPKYLSLLNKGWMILGLILSKIINPLVLGIIYFGLFTPIGLFRKLIGRDELNLKSEDVNTYWKKRDIINIKQSSFKDQF
tara:strand:- start:200 stop:604 length:405 start_codon:yes stop_codon:yes gene_type:complete